MSETTNPNRSDFIRQHPDLTPNEVVALGGQQGLKFSRNLVYLVRGKRTESAGSAKAKPSPRAPVAARATAAPPAAARGTERREELEIARLVLSLGFDRSEEILRKVKAALRD
jgi:hypothetical protein